MSPLFCSCLGVSSLAFCTRLFLYSMGVVVLLTASPALARDYFDPAFLSVTGNSDPVDLSAFSEPGGIEEGSYTLTVVVNQRDAGQHTLNFKKNAQGRIAPQLTPAFLDTLGVNVKQVPSLKKIPAEQPLDDLSAMIPHALLTLKLAQLQLDISIPQVAMKSGMQNVVDPALWDEGINALMANYTLSAGRSDNTRGNISTYNNNLFTLFRGGANVGPWRLRSTLTYNWSQNGGYENQPSVTTRNTRFSGTYLARNIIPLRSMLLIGESNTESDVFDSISFRGAKISSNEQMLPSQLRGYAPVIEGIANSNARITVRQNGSVVYETWVAAGPFRINDIQQSGLSGDYDVTITEANGNIRNLIVPYSSLPVMQRPGGWKYELTSGRYDGNLTQGSRQLTFMLGTLIYGLPRDVTLYGGSLIAKGYQSMSAGSGISFKNMGAFSADITTSSALFDEGRQSGQSYRIRYSKSLMSTGTSVDLTALRYSTRNYYSFNEYNIQGYRLGDGVNPWLQQRRRSSVQSQISQQMWDWGSFNFRASKDNYWESGRSLIGMSIGYSNSWRGVSYGLNYNVDRMRDNTSRWPENRQLSLSVGIPFSIFGYTSSFQNIYSTTSVIQDNQGRTQGLAGITGSACDQKLSWGGSQSVGSKGQATISNLNAGWQGSKGSLSVGYSHSRDSRTINMNAGGGMLVHRGGVTFSRSMGESVALVSAPGASDVSVSGATAVTDAKGYAVVPYLTAYDKNNVGLDPATLPENVDITRSNLNVYPTRGAVVKADFTTRVGYQALITLKRASGSVPFGASATLEGGGQGEENSSIVGDAGQVYLNGLPVRGSLKVRWGERTESQCLAHFDLKDSHTTPERPVREIIAHCIQTTDRG